MTLFLVLTCLVFGVGCTVLSASICLVTRRLLSSGCANACCSSIVGSPLSGAPWPRYRPYDAHEPCYINPGATIRPAPCLPLPEEVLALEHRKSCIVEQR